MGRPKGSVNKTKSLNKLNKSDFRLVVTYVNTKYVVYQSTKNNELNFILVDTESNNIIAQSSNPLEFNTMIMKNTIDK